jgi:hypothetical protein
MTSHNQDFYILCILGKNMPEEENGTSRGHTLEMKGIQFTGKCGIDFALCAGQFP